MGGGPAPAGVSTLEYSKVMEDSAISLEDLKGSSTKMLTEPIFLVGDSGSIFVL